MKKKNDEIVAWALFALFLLGLICLVRACIGYLSYNDWTCGFRQCVVVKNSDWAKIIDHNDYGTIRMEKLEDGI